MISSLSTLADRSFVISYVLPTLLFSLAAAFLYWDFAGVREIFRNFIVEGNVSKLLHLTVIVWSVSLCLSLVSIPLIKLLEGYHRPLSKFEWLRRSELRRRQAVRDEYERVSTKVEATQTDGLDEAALEALRMQQVDLAVAYRDSFPRSEASVMPTRLGNAIRAFEEYPAAIHGADSVALWPGLLSVMPERFERLIADSRAKFEFLVNVSALSLLLSLLALIRVAGELVSPHVAGECVWLQGVCFSGSLGKFVFLSCCGLLLSRLAYLASVRQAVGWGELVKTAFDNYLPALSVQMGFPLPRDREARIAFWTQAGQQLSLHHPLDAARWTPRSNRPDAPPRRPSRSR